ncbi:hypothetical protein VB711_25060 [Cronbergia sp. UHCC 0137]|nr:hypothetical protein [Cronbergia sp. UHCC 0137]MEA5621078.1 hypothetical protein [Cronbergia sp. UHCC 0137]
MQKHQQVNQEPGNQQIIMQLPSFYPQYRAIAIRLNSCHSRF